MPRVKRRERTRRGGYGEEHLRHLAVGWCLTFDGGFTLGSAFGPDPDTEEMIALFRKWKADVYAKQKEEQGRFPWPHPEHPWAYYLEKGDPEEYSIISAELRRQYEFDKWEAMSPYDKKIEALQLANGLWNGPGSWPLKEWELEYDSGLHRGPPLAARHNDEEDNE